MKIPHRTTSTVVIVRRKREARLSDNRRTIRYAAAVARIPAAGGYWMPAFAGTMERR
jgi:hypothetical protein